MMVSEQNILLILKRFVSCDETDLQLIEPVKPEEIFGIAEKHNLLPLVYEIYSQSYTLPETRELENYQLKAMSQILRQISRTSVFLCVYDELRKAGLDVLVLKGIVCRDLYSDYKDCRPSGDEDILVKKEDFYKVKHLLEKNDFIQKGINLSDEDLSKVQEVSFYNMKLKMCIEVHLNLFRHDGTQRQYMNKYFEDVFTASEARNMDGVDIYTLNHTKSLLYVILHAFNHFVGGGIGLRQMLDILMYYRAYCDEIDMSYIMDVLLENKALSFFADIIYLGNKYLGFSVEQVGNTANPEPLLDDILQNGIFGNQTDEQRAAYHITKADRSIAAEPCFLQLLFRALFPKKEMLYSQYPELMSNKKLLVGIWFKRIRKFFRKIVKTKGKILTSGILLGRKRSILIKQYIHEKR